MQHHKDVKVESHSQEKQMKNCETSILTVRNVIEISSHSTFIVTEFAYFIIIEVNIDYGSVSCATRV